MITSKKTVFLSLILISSLVLGYASSFKNGNFNNRKPSPSLSSKEDFLLDKVFTFTAPELSMNRTYELENGTFYYIRVEIATPHNCYINVSIRDPENDTYSIIGGNLIFNSSYADYYDAPFGVALTGNHTFTFHVTTEQNINIYLSIKKEETWKMYIPHENPLISEIFKFSYGDTKQLHLDLETDWAYRLIFSRVSAIAANKSYYTALSCYIIDPEDLEYPIWNKKELPKVLEFSSFLFGTAIEGEYTVILQVFCNQKFVNMGVGIFKDYKISNVIDDEPPLEPPDDIPSNDTTPINDTIPSNDSITGSKIFHISDEWQMGFPLITGIGIGLIAVVLIIHKRKANEGTTKPI